MILKRRMKPVIYLGARTRSVTGTGWSSRTDTGIGTIQDAAALQSRESAMRELPGWRWRCAAWQCSARS